MVKINDIHRIDYQNELLLYGIVENQYGQPLKEIDIVVEAWCPYWNSKSSCKRCKYSKKYIYCITKTNNKGLFYIKIKNKKLCYKVTVVQNYVDPSLYLGN